jgi:transcription antitermination factor NusG
LPEDRSWFALAVRPRYEKTAARSLRAKSIEEFLPLYRARRQWCDRVKELERELFPGYVFCRLSWAERLAALSAPGVLSIVGFGGRAAPIDDREIEAVRAIVNSGHAVEPWAYLNVGQRVRVTEGCLAGVTGIVLRQKDVCRVLVTIELLQRSVAVEIGREQISPLAAAA